MVHAVVLFEVHGFLKAVKKLTVEVVVKYLQQYLWHTFGMPEVIVSDNGSQLRADTSGQIEMNFRT